MLSYVVLLSKHIGRLFSLQFKQTLVNMTLFCWKETILVIIGEEQLNNLPVDRSYINFLHIYDDEYIYESRGLDNFCLNWIILKLILLIKSNQWIMCHVVKSNDINRKEAYWWVYNWRLCHTSVSNITS